MAVKDLQVRQGKVDITLDIVDVGEVREFEKFGRAGRVATAVGKDKTGDIKLTLWNDDIDMIKPGDKVHITNGYVGEWQGEPQLTTGRFGKLEVIKENEQAKKEMTSEPNEEEDKELYKKIKEKLNEKESKKSSKEESEQEDTEEPFTDEEEIED